MTKAKGFTVALDRDYSPEDAQAICHALSMVRGVLDVKSIEASPDDWINRRRVHTALYEKLFEALKETEEW